MGAGRTAGLERLEALMNAGAESGTGHLPGMTAESPEPGRLIAHGTSTCMVFQPAQ
jgi:hypothetical protein